MKLVAKDTNLKLVIDSDVINEIKNIGIKKHPNEFGGFLVGKYSNDLNTLTITNFLLPKKYLSQPMSFKRSIDGISGILEDLFITKEEYYVGEWHTHPNGSSSYSSTDFNAMKSIAEFETVNIKNPVLLILSISKGRCDEFTFYYYKNEKLIPYEKS